MILTRFKKGDLFVAVVTATLLLAAGAAALIARAGAGDPVAIVIVDGAAVDIINLRDARAEERVYASALGTCAVAFEPGRVRIAAADCPDQVCVHTGWISRPGQSAVCVPGRVAVVVRGDRAEVDAIVG
ncbi:MAG: NusG domain II-containing protein [Clostridiales bacterium]|nr:NusG domain II-containing protein [Clostridiales bacterium]